MKKPQTKRKHLQNTNLTQTYLKCIFKTAAIQ
jgi:hypothetical protein